jgi:hypothetical protein
MNDEIKYLDFELTIEKSDKDKYVMRAEFGSETVEAAFVNPFNQDKREIINSTLTAAALRRTARTRATNAPEVAKMKNFGGTLFKNVIAGSLDEFLTQCRDEAAKEQKGIRWRLTLDPSLEELPWEFLCDRDRFLVLDPRNPIVRYIKPDTWIAPLKAAHPLRLLVVIASPKDEVRLDTDAEKQRILEALRPLVERGQLQISIIEGPDTWERIIDTLLPDETHIFHFIGHGAFDDRNQQGVLIMENADGNAQRINSERLSVLMQGKSRLRLIVLNSCLGSVGESVQPFSSVAAGMVRSGIPAVIAMQFEISDEAAREIAETFYTALSLNRPVDTALTEARRKIYLTQEDSLEWATPILYMQVPDGQLFEFAPAPPGVINLQVIKTAGASPEAASWGDRWNDLANWWKSGKESKSPKEGAIDAEDMFDRGREIWYTIIGAKGSSSSSEPSNPKLTPVPLATPTPEAKYRGASPFPHATPILPVAPGALPKASIPQTDIEERIDSTVYAPNQAEPGNCFLVQVFVHLPEQAESLDALAKMADTDAGRRVRSQIQEPIARGTQLTFLLAMPGLEIDDSSQSCIWGGEPTAVQFGVTVPKDFEPGDVLATVTICASTIPIGHLKFKFTVVAKGAGASAATESNVASNLVRYRRAFISYASADRSEVLKRVQMMSLLKPRIEYFQDLLTLDPGDPFEKLIYQYIDESDVLFLFWSEAASKSSWVEKEILYAKNRKVGGGQAGPEIIPVLIEGPPPVKPPAQLDFLHFNDRFLYFINPRTDPPPLPPPVVRPSPRQPIPPVPSPVRPVVPHPPPDVVKGWRLYQIADTNTKPLAEAFRQRLSASRLETQMIQQGNTWLVQGKRSGATPGQQTILAATILIEASDRNLKISIGSGKCVNGAFNLGDVISGELSSLMPLGMGQAMLNELWSVAESFVSFFGGKRIA